MSILKLPMQEQEYMCGGLFVTVTLSVTGYHFFPWESPKVLACQSAAILTLFLLSAEIIYSNDILVLSEMIKSCT